MKVRNTRSHQEGFTLIELLVVVAIIALLVTVAVPKLFDAINKAKTGKGAADLDTVSSALERYYFDNNNYPAGASPNGVDGALKNTNGTGYVKAGTTFTNGFNKGYLYETNATGGYYVMADPGNNTGSVFVVCGSWTSNQLIIGASVYIDNTKITGPQTGDVAAGCSVQASVSNAPSGTPLAGTKVVSN